MSQSAVSRTFTPGASVSPKTRAKVLSSASDLGYRPNAIARSLITSRSRLVAVVMAYLENLYYPDVLQELGRALGAKDYHLLLFTGKDRDTDPVFEQLMQYRVDGIILASTPLTSKLSDECIAGGIPVVLFNRKTERVLASSVTTRNYEGGWNVARFLVLAGHSTFGYIAGMVDSSTDRDRFAGFRAGLVEHGKFRLTVGVGNYSRRDAEAAARCMFADKDRPDAVFVANDHMAVAVMDVARYEFDLSIPEDVSIVGFDDVGAAAWKSYDITSVEQPVRPMVQATVDILLRQMGSGNLEPIHEVISGDLVVRSSARRPGSRFLAEVDGRTVFRPD